MTDIHHSAEANAPVSVVFDHVDDFTQVPKWMFGLQSMEPATEQTSGVGAVFDCAMKVGPTTLRSTIEVTEWERNHSIAMKSIKGFVNRSTWRFEPVDDDRTRMVVDFTYELPGGLAGKAIGKAIEPFVSVCIRHSERQLREQVEEIYANGKADRRER